jgi:protocatechuate 3,4-dioxygenase beta subunit
MSSKPLRRVVSAFAFFLLAFFLVTLSTFAQYRAGIQGSVLDPQGDAISGATVTLVNKETNRTQAVASGASGVYNFLSLPPGHYSLSAQAANSFA